VLEGKNFNVAFLYLFYFIINFSVIIGVLLSVSFGFEWHLRGLVGILSADWETRRAVLVEDATDKLSSTSRVMMVLLRVVLSNLWSDQGKIYVHKTWTGVNSVNAFWTWCFDIRNSEEMWDSIWFILFWNNSAVLLKCLWTPAWCDRRCALETC
jgi:hypothetical protein